MSETPQPVVFHPLVDFSDQDLRSAYLVGYSYTVRPGNDFLAAKVAKWLEEGKVRVGPPKNAETAPAKVSGTGTVS